MLPDSARLSLDALVRLVRRERIGELPDVLSPTAVWLPREEAEANQTSADAEAERLGWLDRGGRLDADVVQSLTALCRANVEYYGWIAARSRLGVLAAATGREAILAVRDGDEIVLLQSKPKKLPEALVSQIPEVPPGTGSPVSVPVDELRAAAANPPPGAVSAKSVPRTDLRRVMRIIAQRTSGSGELWVAARDRLGRRRVIASPLRYADTEWGRFLNVAEVSDGGELWWTLAPASPAELVRRLRVLRQSLR
ncbi:hypothetical protein ALI144C_34930 [Actinosynnema sp. ALI-1.44]|uniref:ESX secretion-associated protein EspG n=1 Tax=Actinosynnema sp. ALI-1.44 TaxID=1933779 RepID=UPI00097BF94D|nr:ESX secretion-associated protein EspG [Actinosynnema sp. ALI-1.44]ONI77260.1 hypothetical protein ALI144C_34930 [Actinosynnema sp. ALI-1.44]